MTISERILQLNSRLHELSIEEITNPVIYSNCLERYRNICQEFNILENLKNGLSFSQTYIYLEIEWWILKINLYLGGGFINFPTGAEGIRNFFQVIIDLNNQKCDILQQYQTVLYTPCLIIWKNEIAKSINDFHEIYYYLINSLKSFFCTIRNDPFYIETIDFEFE